MNFISKQRAWLLPTVLVLLILEVITLPIMISLTYAGKSESPEHILTYRPHELTWDESTEVRADGTGVLSLFDTVYQNVNSDNEKEKVLAPGTEGDNLVRLKNEAENTVGYTAVLYTIRSTGNLPVGSSMTGDGKTTEEYGLPKGVGKESVVRALTGTLKSGQIADFKIDWYWNFEEGDEQDVIDTGFGDRAAMDDAEDVLMGIYIVVEDDGTVKPEPPKTGDSAMIYGYGALFVLSVVLLIFSIPRKKKEEETKA